MWSRFSVPSHTGWLTLSQKIGYNTKQHLYLHPLFHFHHSGKGFLSMSFMKGQQPHIIMVHLSKCWSTNFCSLIVHGPTQQNPTSSHSLLKVCSNLADILLFHFRHSRQDTLSMLHKVNNYISPGSICPNTGVLLSIYLLFSVPLSKNPISSISVTNIKTCSNCQCLP